MHDFEAFADQERGGWSDPAIVDAYVRRIAPITDQIAEALVARTVKPGMAVLDLCCGHGRLTAMIGAAGANATGSDFSPDMLALARIAAPDATLHEADAAALPFANAAFDAVLCNFGMMHLPDQPKALLEIRRVLRPDGRFAMSTWLGPADLPAFGTMLSAIKAHADMSKAPVQPDMFAFAAPDTAARLMADAGLRITARDVLAPAWDLTAPQELFEIFATATVGVSMMIRSQPPHVVEAIRKHVAETVSRHYAQATGYRVEIPVAVVHAEPIS